MNMPGRDLEEHHIPLKLAPSRMHHAVFLEGGQVESSEVRTPMTLWSRAQRLSGLQGRFDFSIFGGPS